MTIHTAWPRNQELVTMNQQQIFSVVRDILQIAGTFLTTYGVINAQQWEPIAGVVLMLTPIIWGVINHTQVNAVAIVASMPETKVTPDGKTITLHDSELALAAREHATPLVK